jgi:hypothetical protein
MAWKRDQDAENSDAPYRGGRGSRERIAATFSSNAVPFVAPIVSRHIGGGIVPRHSPDDNIARAWIELDVHRQASGLGCPHSEAYDALTK